jgi:1-acyl-sn-glycerol-3-phosphate acyltransferase
MDYRNWRKSSGWLYMVYHPMAHIAYRLLFKKIYLHNRQGIKADAPVLIAANHPTAFVDPILFCIFFDPPVYNMTRGDLFRKPFFRRILEGVNMFPVFRRRDGFDGRDRNDEVFEYCQRKMMEGVAVNIFVEGEHHLDKRVLPAQKGIARVAFGTYERHRLDELQIVPVGCNYISGERPRDEVQVIVGQPIFVKDYWGSYQQNPANAIAQLCRDIETALREQCCYHIEDRKDYALAEQLLEIWRNDRPAKHLPIVEHNAGRFFGRKSPVEPLERATRRRAA